VLPSPTTKLLWPNQVITHDADALLATLPTEAGGLHFDGVYAIDDSLMGGSPVDDALAAVGKNRRDALSVFRYSEDPAATIGATLVAGIDGDALLEAFARTWDAPAVIRRSQRAAGGSLAWELEERGGMLTFLYQRANAVYLAATHDPTILDATVADMPPPAE
jgi:hypothetical protein